MAKRALSFEDARPASRLVPAWHAQPFRLAAGGLIDRSRTLRFRFDGRALEGHPGDSLASALLANGVRLVGRSFKYHRPRGILSAGSRGAERAGAARRGRPRRANTRATMVPLARRAGRAEPEPLALARASI